jgi:hypothetical protein
MDEKVNKPWNWSRYTIYISWSQKVERSTWKIKFNTHMKSVGKEQTYKIDKRLGITTQTPE